MCVPIQRNLQRHAVSQFCFLGCHFLNRMSELHWPLVHTGMTATFYVCFVHDVMTTATSPMWLLCNCNIARATDKLNFIFYLIFINWNLSSHMGLMATAVDRVVVEPYCFLICFSLHREMEMILVYSERKGIGDYPLYTKTIYLKHCLFPHSWAVPSLSYIRYLCMCELILGLLCLGIYEYFFDTRPFLFFKNILVLLTLCISI